MTVNLRIALGVAALAITAPALAKTDWVKAPPDPAKAYVLAQIDPVEFKMMGNNKIATGITLAGIDANGQMRPIRKDGKFVGIARLALAGDAIAKDGKRRLYFAEIEPGSWVIEGAGAGLPTLAGQATAFSLGSYKFEAVAGQIVDFGVMTPRREDSDNPDTKMSGGKLAGMILAGPFGGGRVEPLPLTVSIRPRGTGDLPLPAWVSASRLVHPALTYGVTFQNTLGGLVNRIDGKAGRGRAAGEIVYPSKPAT